MVSVTFGLLEGMQADKQKYVDKLEPMEVPTGQTSFQPNTSFRGLLAQIRSPVGHLLPPLAYTMNKTAKASKPILVFRPVSLVSSVENEPQVCTMANARARLRLCLVRDATRLLVHRGGPRIRRRRRLSLCS